MEYIQASQIKRNPKLTIYFETKLQLLNILFYNKSYYGIFVIFCI